MRIFEELNIPKDLMTQFRALLFVMEIRKYEHLNGKPADDSSTLQLILDQLKILEEYIVRSMAYMLNRVSVDKLPNEDIKAAFLISIKIILNCVDDEDYIYNSSYIPYLADDVQSLNHLEKTFMIKIDFDFPPNAAIYGTEPQTSQTADAMTDSDAKVSEFEILRMIFACLQSQPPNRTEFRKQLTQYAESKFIGLDLLIRYLLQLKLEEIRELRDEGLLDIIIGIIDKNKLNKLVDEKLFPKLLCHASYRGHCKSGDEKSQGGKTEDIVLEIPVVDEKYEFNFAVVYSFVITTFGKISENDIPSARTYLRNAEDLLAKIPNFFPVVIDFKKAIPSLNQALIQANGFSPEQVDLSKDLSKKISQETKTLKVCGAVIDAIDKFTATFPTPASPAALLAASRTTLASGSSSSSTATSSTASNNPVTQNL